MESFTLYWCLPFTYFYTAVIYQPEQMAENLQKQGGFVPGMRPGSRDGRVSQGGHESNSLSRSNFPVFDRSLASFDAVCDRLTVIDYWWNIYSDRRCGIDRGY